jgi:outer membrane receptor protein involved in Fe transport
MKKFLNAIIVLIAFHSINITSQDEVQEIVVTSAFIDTSEINNPLYVIDGAEFSDGATTSLGDAIDEYLGLSIADYGSAVGQPIIRGMSGPRVKILKNGVVNRDVSGLGVDHLNDVDLNDISQVEIVKGPSSLLYANGTIGGIINVVDDLISTKNFEIPEVSVGYESQSVNDGNSEFVNLKGNVGGFNVNFGYKNTDFGNYDVPSGAVIHSEEEHHDEDDHDEDEHHEDEDDHHEEEGEHHEDEHDDHGHGNLIHANYMQEDAEFDGYEIEIGRSFDLGSGELALSFGRDVVNAEFADGHYIPRINPARNIYSLVYTQDDLLFKLMLKDVEKQNDIGEGETATDAYQMLNTRLTKTFNGMGEGELKVSLFANNLLDEVARNHSSFVKNEVPLPGRNYGLKFNLTF